MVKKTQETRVTTETIELFICPVCEQKYEQGDLLRAEIDRKEEPLETLICLTCAEALFDYDGESTPENTWVKKEKTTDDDVNVEMVAGAFIAGFILSSTFLLPYPFNLIYAIGLLITFTLSFQWAWYKLGYEI